MTSPIEAYFEIVYVSDTDLTDEQIAITQKTYLDHAEDYVKNYERRSGALEWIRPHTLDPFLAYYRKTGMAKPILFVGCGSGRDLQEAERLGFSCHGVDLSPAILKIARKSGIKSPLDNKDLLNLDYPDNQFGGIFCETALSHIKKTDLPDVLKNFHRILGAHGVGLVGFRLGDGRIYYSDDLVGGRRYNTTMPETEAADLLKLAEFKILATESNPIPGRINADFFIKKL